MLAVLLLWCLDQMVKPLERNTRYVDAVMTVPKGTLFPMCGMNLAFDRSLIGPAMYFGLMGEGQPIGRYDDMWAGWCSKVTAAPALLMYECFLLESGLPTRGLIPVGRET